ncbi:MAG: NADH-quinone oxidoreductase subunit J [Deltaproteobacteria bacterium]|nr:NADH-quinone oxidoreductase subunit J [Deltaproteobacteria bacterium]MBI3295468.1 NADH-quinone oxidoreductase subunit J [Deltaproteobacteria bacterium]
MSDIAAGLFGVLTLGCSLGVVFSRNVIMSAFYLILSFFGLAALYVLIQAPFLAVIQVLIYTGAIVVLFVFVVMLIDQDKLLEVVTGKTLVLTAGVLAWSLGLILLRALNHSPMAVPVSGQLPTLRTISLSLFTEYLWPFEVLSVFMLVIIVGVFVLARDKVNA